MRSIRYSTIRLKFRKLVAATALFALVAGIAPHPASATLQTDPKALYRTMKSAFDRGAANGWHFADEVYYFSTVLDAGRAYELVRRDDPDNLTIKGLALDLATRLNYDPLLNRDAALWYVRLAAGAYTNDPSRGAAAKALLAKLDVEDANLATLAHDADADATANAAAYPNDVEALIDQVDADLRAYDLTKDVHYRSIALARAAQPVFPIGLVPTDTNKSLLAAANGAREGKPGFDDNDRLAARAMFSHKASAKSIAIIGRVLSHDAYLVITAPADEYFGHTKLSPIGVSNEIIRIGKYLDAGWGDRMTGDTLYVVDTLEDMRHQYPRDYEVPRLLLRVYTLLGRMNSAEAKSAAKKVRRTLTVEYNASPEARSLLASS